jgi:hypothetical protein
MKRVVPFLFLFLVLSVPAALAEVEGSCTITMNGVDANTLSTPGDALEVGENDTIAIEATSETGKFTGHTVYLEYGGIKWKVDEAVDDGKSWTGSVDVADYAKYGVGLYKVSGESTGVECSGWAFINVSGNPLGTAAGAAAAGATAIGGALVVGSAMRASRRPRKKVQEIMFSKAPEDADSIAGDPTIEPGSTGKALRELAQLDGAKIGAAGEAVGMCRAMVPVAMVQTMAFMVSGAGAAGAPGAAQRKKPGLLISVTGLIGAVLAGLGTLVLAQQYGVLYPTATVAIVWLVAWVVVDIIWTTMARRSGVRKAYAMIEAEEARLGAAAPQAEPPAPEAPQREDQ